MPKLKKDTVYKDIPSPENGKIVALDVSLEHTGVSIIDINLKPNLSTDKHVNNLVIEINKGKKTLERITGPARLSAIKKQLSNLINTEDLVIIEGYAFGARGSSGISLGELGGVIRTWLYESGVRYIEIPPTQIKKFITGSGNAPKETMLKEVYKRYNFDTNDNNLADAYCIGEVGLALVGKNEQCLTVGQRVVIQTILKSYWEKEV